MWSLVGCAGALVAIGWVFHGPRAPMLAAVCVAFAAAAEWICSWLTRRRWQSGMGHSLAMGLLVALMLPATAPWYVAAAGGTIAVGVGKWLMGGFGHYPWNPAVVAILGVYLLWPGWVAPQRWPLLSREHVIAGYGLSLARLADEQSLVDWQRARPPGSAVGFAMPRADTVLHEVVDPSAASESLSLEAAVRDLLPSAWDVLSGSVAGTIGQGSALALVLVGLTLIWRGYLRWALPAAVIAGAFAAAAVLPVAGVGWLPIRHVADGLPVGLAWVGYHVLLAPTLFTAVLLAGETVTSPVTNRGQVAFGLGVGVLTVALRWWPVALMSGCWAVLAMNTLVPVIDRIDRRWRILTGR